MTAPPLAHAGHWLAQVAYALPLVLVVVALVVSKVRERRAGGKDAAADGRQAETDPGARAASGSREPT
jgi:hypothetical protein